MMEMDGVMTSNLWHYSSYSQPLYQRYCYDHHPHGSHLYQTPDAMPPIFKSPQPYCDLNYARQSPSSVGDAWRVVRGATAGDRQWPAAVTGHVLDRATDAAVAVAAAAHHGWAPYSGIGQ